MAPKRSEADREAEAKEAQSALVEAIEQERRLITDRTARIRCVGLPSAAAEQAAATAAVGVAMRKQAKARAAWQKARAAVARLCVQQRFGTSDSEL
jgi:hypothetical protein